MEIEEEISELEMRKAEFMAEFQPIDESHISCLNEAKGAKFKMQKMEVEKSDLEKDIESTMKKLQDTEILIQQTLETENESTQYD